MTLNVPFCTCAYTDCPNHPSNHNQGCTLCIAKNLRQGEIPECFLHQAEQATGRKCQGVKREDYARLVLGWDEKPEN